MAPELSLFSRREVLSVSEVLARLGRCLEEQFGFVWVVGEVGELKRASSGHIYFSLKDEKGLLKAVIFRNRAYLFSPLLEEGAQVLCQGRLEVYRPGGRLTFVVEAVEPQGAGALAAAFERLKRRLAAEGLFNQERKRPLPRPIVRVILLTSPVGAALADFLRVLGASGARVDVGLWPVRVQGEGAGEELAKAVAEAGESGWGQVVVLARGGGSLEDLWAFNHEGLARAIAGCAVPVVCAVGHEIDLTIADLVADVRAPTPTAAAQMLAGAWLEDMRVVNELSQALVKAIAGRMERTRLGLESVVRRLRHPVMRVHEAQMRVDELLSRAKRAVVHRTQALGSRLEAANARLWSAGPRTKVSIAVRRWEELVRRLGGAVEARLRGLTARVQRAEAMLKALGPGAVLARGYALVRDSQGRVIRSGAELGPGQKVEVTLARGGFGATVDRSWE